MKTTYGSGKKNPNTLRLGWNLWIFWNAGFRWAAGQLLACDSLLAGKGVTRLSIQAIAIA